MHILKIGDKLGFMKYIRSLLPNQTLLMKGGYIELLPGQCKPIAEEHLNDVSVFSALRGGQAEILEGPVDTYVTPAPLIVVSEPDFAKSLSAEELVSFLASKQDGTKQASSDLPAVVDTVPPAGEPEPPVADLPAGGDEVVADEVDGEAVTTVDPTFEQGATEPPKPKRGRKAAAPDA